MEAARTAQELLGRVQRSAAFADDGRVGALLEYICERTQAGHFDVLNEHDIGVMFFGFEPGHDAAENPVVRDLTAELRVRLREFFQGEGRREVLRIAIPPGEYRAFLYEADPRVVENQESALESFWKPYLVGGPRSYLLHGEQPGESVLIAEAYGFVQITLVLEKLGGGFQLAPVGAVGSRDLAGKNLILLGTPETNPLLARFITEPYEAAVIQRVEATEEHGVITAIAAQEPEQLMAAVEYATSESRLERALRDLGQRWPGEFRIDVAVRS